MEWRGAAPAGGGGWAGGRAAWWTVGRAGAAIGASGSRWKWGTWAALSASRRNDAGARSARRSRDSVVDVRLVRAELCHERGLARPRRP